MDAGQKPGQVLQQSRPPKADESRVERSGTRSSANASPMTKVAGVAEGWCVLATASISSDKSTAVIAAARGDKSCPIAGPACNLEHVSVDEIGGHELVEIAEVVLTLRLRVHFFVLVRPRRVIGENFGFG